MPLAYNLWPRKEISNSCLLRLGNFNLKNDHWCCSCVDYPCLLSIAKCMGQLTQKWKCCNHLLTLMSSQTTCRLKREFLISMWLKMHAATLPYNSHTLERNPYSLKSLVSASTCLVHERCDVGSFQWISLQFLNCSESFVNDSVLVYCNCVAKSDQNKSLKLNKEVKNSYSLGKRRK